MRHGRSLNRLSRSANQRKALLAHTVRNVLRDGRIRTTLAKAKQCQRLADRLISLGKDGSVHARRQAYRVLQDRRLVKQLFADVAPRFLGCQGGYTRVLKLSPRAGDGAPQALLELTRVVEPPKTQPKAKPKHATAPPEPAASKTPEKAEEGTKKPKRFFEGLRELFRLRTRGSES